MLAEMDRLYVEERLSLDAVGKILGVSRQAVHERLRKAGIETRRYTPPVETKLQRIRKEIDVAWFVRQYASEKKSILELSRAYGVSYGILRDILRFEGVPIRPRGSQTKIKYPQLYALKVGESVLLDLSPLKAPYSSVACIGYRMKARLSARRLENSAFRVKRLV